MWYRAHEVKVGHMLYLNALVIGKLYALAHWGLIPELLKMTPVVKFVKLFIVVYFAVFFNLQA